MDAVRKVHDTFGTDVWLEALSIMENALTMTCEDAIVSQYRDAFTDATDGRFDAS